jgi:predicted transcriptional regulator
MTFGDMLQVLPEADEKTRDMLIAARCILAAVTDPKIGLTITGIAEATGLTLETVKHILNSAVYRQLLEDQFHLRVSSIMTRGIVKMDEIIHREKARDADKVAAYRTVVATYQAMVDSMPKHDGASAKNDFQAALDLLDRIKRPQPQVAIAT